jgi:hypothetical protein
MTAKKKTKTKQSRSTKTIKRSTSAKKSAQRKTSSKKKSSARKRISAKKKSIQKKAPIRKKRTVAAKSVVKKTVGASPRKPRERDEAVDTQFSRSKSSTRSAGQAGDLQGLSDAERADSESVDELLEEGNAFEADVVAGVQDAGNAEGSEVHTHEVPEDDVPGEYLDEE